MAYFTINGTDYSMYVNELKVNTAHNYTSQTNAAGNTTVDYINTKRQIEVGIIPLLDWDTADLLNAIEPVTVTVGFRNPRTQELEETLCLIPNSNVEYYTIRQDKVMYKAFTLTFIEL